MSGPVPDRPDFCWVVEEWWQAWTLRPGSPAQMRADLVLRLDQALAAAAVTLLTPEPLDVAALRRRYTPDVLDDIARNPHNVGAKEVRELVALARLALAAASDAARAGEDWTPTFEAVDPADLERLKATWALRHTGEPGFEFREDDGGRLGT